MSHISNHEPSAEEPYNVQPPSYTNAGEMRPNDDWSEITDRKLKKRMQNRVAQRTYRQRMKARLEELQAKLDDSNRTNQITDTKTAKTASIGSRPDENRTDGLDRTATLESPFEVAPARLSTTQPSDASSNHLAAQSDRDSQVRGKGTYDITGHHEQSHRDYANNMARQEETRSNGLMGTVAMAELSQQGCPSIMPENDESVDFFLGSLDTWKPEEFAQLIHQTPSPLDLTGSDAPSTAAASASLPPSSSLENLASLEAKFELVMECVGAAGFGSFDALVKSYYGDAFGEGSRLSNEQRLSRSRRLPSVLSDIVRSAGSWGAWERRGLYEEVLKAAEEALIGEHGRAGSAMDDCIAPVVESEGNPSAGCVRRAIAALTSAAPTSLPSQWALLMALAASDKPAWQRDCPGTALAIVVLLQFAGRISTDQVMDLIRACIEP